MMAWVLLFVAGLLETCWAIGLKYTKGFTELWPSVFTAAALVGSMYLLATAVKTLPIGTAYAVWVGIGALGAAIAGIFLLHEPVTPGRIAFLALLIIAILGLKITSA